MRSAACKAGDRATVGAYRPFRTPGWNVRHTDVCPGAVFRRGRGMCSYKSYLQLALGALLAMLQGLSQASAYVDVLDLPARVSALAVTSPLSDMARAGDRLVAVGQRGHILYSD